jgi:hypothetical protein
MGTAVTGGSLFRFALGRGRRTAAGGQTERSFLVSLQGQNSGGQGKTARSSVIFVILQLEVLFSV